MSGRLEGKVAVVTGGASGIGRAAVEHFVEEGAAVVVGDLNAPLLEAMPGELAPSVAERVRTRVTDVSDEADMARLMAMATDAFGHLDIVFNNAGIGGAFGPITEIEVEDWDRTFAVLVRSVFLGTKHASRIMIEQGRGGSIINTASIAGMGGGAGPQAYSAAKAAVVNLTKTTADELAPHRIRVNAICPGMIFTPLMHGGKEEQAESVMLDIQPWPERGEPMDIARVAGFLASDDARFVTGQEHIVDGGLMAAGPRSHGRVPNTRNMHRMVGMAHGTTGQPTKVRRL